MLLGWKTILKLVLVAVIVPDRAGQKNLEYNNILEPNYCLLLLAPHISNELCFQSGILTMGRVYCILLFLYRPAQISQKHYCLRRLLPELLLTDARFQD